jgi:hypothetical protein
MTEIRKADPAARRKALRLVILGALIGMLLIVGFERYGTLFRDWLLSDPRELSHRLRLGFFLAAALLSAPLIVFAVYLWSLGAKTLCAREFPPTGSRVIRDIPILGGHAAVLRGRVLKAVALCLGVASALLWLLLWRLAGVLSERVTQVRYSEPPLRWTVERYGRISTKVTLRPPTGEAEIR